MRRTRTFLGWPVAMWQSGKVLLTPEVFVAYANFEGGLACGTVPVQRGWGLARQRRKLGADPNPFRGVRPRPQSAQALELFQARIWLRLCRARAKWQTGK